MQFTHPLDDHIVTRGFAFLSSLYVGGQHAAIDLVRKTGQTHGAQVLAVAAGEVVGNDCTSLSGWYVSIAHANGWTSHYRHLRGPTCAADSVVQGQLVGYAGNTGSASLGAHLHFDLWCTTKHDNGAFAKHGLWAHDPELYLGKEDDDMALTVEEHAMLQTIHHFAKISGPAMQAAILAQARAAHAHAKAANAKCKAIETKINNLVAEASGGHWH